MIKFNLAPGVGELFKMVVMDECRTTSRDDLEERKVISDKIEEQELNLFKAGYPGTLGQAIPWGLEHPDVWELMKISINNQ